MKTLILASGSPYRRQLLDRLGLDYRARSPDIDETPATGEAPGAYVARLAEAKARAVAACHADAVVIGSDQAAVIDGEILGKPGNHDRARAQLLRASGRCVEFLTGLAVVDSVSGRLQLDVIPYRVHFRELDPERIDRYLAREKPFDCAGSFKAEALGVALFERMEGDDPNALIGLPLIRLVRMLEHEGFRIP